MRASLLLLLAACAGSSGDTGTDPDTSLETDSDTTAPDPLSDEDGDGLTYQEEMAGWTLTLNTTGYGQDIRNVQVTADPTLADADGDGLSDYDERLYNADPNTVDTDNDGLSDYDEVRRWRTNPSQVDTDGDARGQDPAFPAPPNRALFDGAELDLSLVDGRWTPGINATSPLFADTDGDGMSDYEERALTRRFAVLAEVPDIEIAPSPFTGMDLSLDVVYDDNQGVTDSFSASVEWENSTEWSSMNSRTVGMSGSVSVRGEFSASADVGLSFSAEGSVDGRVTVRGRTFVDWGIEQDNTRTASVTEEHQRFHQATRQNGHTVTGAQIQMLVDVQNTGSRAYLVEGLGVVVYRWTGLGLEPVAYLEPTVPPFTLGPGEWFTGLALRDNAPNARSVQALMKSPNRIVIGTATLDLLDQTGDDFAYVDETVHERTSRLNVEAPSGQVHLDVASHVDRTDEGLPAGISVGDALDHSGVDWQTTTLANPVSGSDETVLSVDGVAPTFHESPVDVALWAELDVAGFTLSNPPGPRRLRSGWYLVTERFDPLATEDDTPLWDTRLFPGDSADLFYGIDADQDGIVDREEWASGSSDEHIDSDYIQANKKDGLSDYWEIREGWMVSVEGETPYRVFSDPGSLDFDRDGLWDDAELAAGTDPRLADTDGDGYSDLGELSAVGLNLDPLRADPPVSLSVTCVNKPGVWGTYVITVDSTFGAPIGTDYTSMEPECWEDLACSRNRSLIDQGGNNWFEAEVEVVNTLTRRVVEVLSPTRIDWGSEMPTARGFVGNLAAVETTCPLP